MTVDKQVIKASLEILERLGLGEGAVLQKSDGSRIPIESMSDVQVQEELRELEDEWNRQRQSGLLRKSSGIGPEDMAKAAVDAINKGRAGIPDALTLEKHKLRMLRKAIR